jgi:5-dehydro-2-deoxygluconokinase
LLVEVILPLNRPMDSETMARSIQNIYDYGIFPDWWKLQPPEDDATWSSISGVIEKNDPHCRGVILLGLNAPIKDLGDGFRTAAGHPMCKGFAVGRTVFQDTAENWFAGKLSDDQVVDEISDRYSQLIRLWNESHAS